MRFLLGRFLITLAIAVATTDSPKSSAQAAFSARDSIEMTVFSDPYTRDPAAISQSSPDGRWFFVVATNGQLLANKLQSKIWLFQTSDVATYLDGHRLTPPVPRLLAVHVSVPLARQYGSYGAVITQAQWSSDSSRICFLAEGSSGKKKLYEVTISNGVTAAVTPTAQDVEDYSERGGTLAYLVKTAHAWSAAAPGRPINESASVLTGLSLAEILDPSLLHNSDGMNASRDLWVRNGKQPEVRINRIEGKDKWHFPAAISTQLRPAVSPNGKYLIAAMPAAGLSPAWKQYKFASQKYRFETLDISSDPTGTVWSWPWQYVLVNIRKRTVAPLVNAPSAMQAGYYDPFQAAWSKDGSKVIFTNSFMPMTKQQVPERGPCAVAVFTLRNGSSSCIAATRFPKTDTHLIDAIFGSAGEVIVRWNGAGKTTKERYEERNNIWTLTEPASDSEDARGVVSLFIKQDIGAAPTLWARNVRSGVMKILWDPNPQLRSLRMSEATLYHWTDSTGYQWTAGLVKPLDYVPGRRYPMVIQTHGFFNEHEFLVDGAFTTGFAAQPLATSGFMVLQMGDRIDRHIKDATEEAQLMTIAFQDAVQSMDRDGLIDPASVGVIGFSRTSWYVETALVLRPRLFKAATIIDGVDQSYVTYMLFCTEYRECRIDHDAANGGPPFGNNLLKWLTTADGFNLDKVQTPLRIETIGPMSVLGEWEIYSSLSLQGKSVDLIDLHAGQHILQKPQQRYVSQQGNVDWFRFWLQGYERPNAEDREQYKRWERLLRSHDTGDQ